MVIPAPFLNLRSMYRIKEIQDKLLHVVGWEQSYNPAEAIAEQLTETESGLYFQGAHPLVTLDNMAAIVPDNWGYQYPVWNDTKEWKVTLCTWIGRILLKYPYHQRQYTD